MSFNTLYLKGEALGRKDGAMRWGMLAASSFLNETEWMGYSDGYNSTASL